MVGAHHFLLTLAEIPATEPVSVAASAAQLSPEDRQLRDRLFELLGAHRGNVAAVARELGKPRTHVHRLTARLGVDRKPG